MLMVDGRDVFGGHANLDDLQVLGRFEHAVADLRRLDDAVAGSQDERRTLILVDQPDPAAVAEDQLKADRVVMDHVGHGSGVGDADVRRDDAAAQPPGIEIAIAHARPADHPRRVVLQPAHDECVPVGGDSSGGLAAAIRTRVPFGASSSRWPPGKRLRIAAEQPHDTRRMASRRAPAECAGHGRTKVATAGSSAGKMVSSRNPSVSMKKATIRRQIVDRQTHFSGLHIVPPSWVMVPRVHENATKRETKGRSRA